MDVDVKGKRLFVAGLENGSGSGGFEAGRWTKSIPGSLKPQGIAYVAALNKLFVASGDDGWCACSRRHAEQLDAIKLIWGQNRVAYERVSRFCMSAMAEKDAGKDYGEVGAMTRGRTKDFDVQVAAHPSEFCSIKSGETLFVFISVASKSR